MNQSKNTKTILLHIVYSIVHSQKKDINHKTAFEEWKEDHRDILDDIVTDNVVRTYESTVLGRSRGDITQTLAMLFLREMSGSTTPPLVNKPLLVGDKT